MTSTRSARAASAASSVFLVSVVSILVVLGMAISGCSGETESLVGTWTSAEQDETLDFRSDGTLYFTMADGQVKALEWQADDQNLAIAVEGGESETFAYSIKAGVLTLTYDGEESAQYQRLELQGE